MEEEKTTNINIKNESHQSGKISIFTILGIILVVLFLISVFIDIQADLSRCAKLKDCKPLETAVATKIFLVDYHINNEISFLKNNTIIIPTNSTSYDTIVPERAVRTDLFVNIFFYLILLVLIIYASYLIGKKGFTGVLTAVLGLSIYFVALIIITGILTKEIYMPMTCFVSLFKYLGVVV